MEVVVSGASKSTSDSFVSVTDLHTGTPVHTFKQSQSGPRSSIVSPYTVLVAQDDRATINVYRWHKEAVDEKLLLPEKVSCLSSSHDGKWLLAGTAAGRVYLWERSTGNLSITKNVHYTGVLDCAWSNDDKMFFTASKDTSIKIWRMIDLFDPDVEQDNMNAWHELQGHTQPVKAIHIGSGIAQRARIYSISADNSFRIFDVATGNAISVTLFPSLIESMLVEGGERVAYVGMQNGDIMELKLYSETNSVYTAATHGSVSTTQGITNNAFTGNTSAVTALALSLDGSMLVSGAQDGRVLIWDVATKQLIRTLRQHTSMVTMLNCQVLPAQKESGRHAAFQGVPLKRVQVERDIIEHEALIPLQSRLASHYRPASDMHIAAFSIETLLQATAAAQETSTISRLEQELAARTSAFDDLKRKHDHLQREYVKMQI